METNSSNTPPASPKRGRGRPKRADAPIVPWDVVDRALVHGEKVTDPETGKAAVVFPSMGDLAKRYGVSRNRIWQYATKKKCLERRNEMDLRERVRYDAIVAERRAEAHARATEDVLAIIDDCLTTFVEAHKEGKVRIDTAADLDRLVRLKELIEGNADSRQAIMGSLSLDTIQQRHHRLRAQLDAVKSNPAIEGVADNRADAASERAPDDVH